MIQQFGVHRVRHGNVMDQAGIRELMGSDKAHIMYSDPPWGDGNIKFWATYNKKVTGQVVQPTPLNEFLNRIFSIAGTYCAGHLLIEYGCRWAADIRARGLDRGFQYHGKMNLFYKGGGKTLPLDLHMFSRPGVPMPQAVEAARDSMGYKTLTLAVPPLTRYWNEQGVRQPVILDPCCGMGYTAQAAVDNRMAFRGNELNAARLAKTIARLA
jgi:hypothetical protein